ncbi:hypothetical protein D3C72_2371030 [compost metagenome]
MRQEGNESVALSERAVEVEGRNDARGNGKLRLCSHTAFATEPGRALPSQTMPENTSAPKARTRDVRRSLVVTQACGET